MCSCLLSICVVVILIIIIWLVYFPWHIKYGEASNKKSAINRARRLRKIGSKIPPPFPNGWFAIAQSKEIKPGTAKNIDCLGENFVVFRSQSNEVFVLDAYCPHMGANLGVGGIVKGKCIECPFHQWKFSGVDGSCVDVPYSENFSEIEKIAKIRKWTSIELNGVIFVWYHAEDEEPWTIPILNTNNMWLHGSNEFIVNSHIQDIPENGADIAHLSSVHGPSMLAGTDVRKIHSSCLSIGTHIWEAKWSLDENNRHIAHIKLTHAIKIFSIKLFHIESIIHQIGPGIVMLELKTFFGVIKILLTLTPLEPLVQRLSHYFYGSPFIGFFAKIFICGETVSVARDVMIWENKQFLRNPILAREEKSIKMFRIWFSQFYSENSKTFASTLNNNFEF